MKGAGNGENSAGGFGVAGTETGIGEARESRRAQADEKRQPCRRSHLTGGPAHQAINTRTQNVANAIEGQGDQTDRAFQGRFVVAHRDFPAYNTVR